MSWNLSIANLDPSTTETKDADGKVTGSTGLTEKLKAAADAEFARNMPAGYVAKAQAAQVQQGIALAVEAYERLLAANPRDAPAPRRISVRISGHANYDGSVSGAHLGVDVHVD